MKYVINFTTSIIISLSLALYPAGYVKASDPTLATATRHPIVIAELKVFDSAGADVEFIELFNPNQEPVDVTGWLIQYRTASSPSDKAWLDKSLAGKDQDTKARLLCGADCRVIMSARGRLLVASPSAGYSDADITPNASLGFASTGGQVRLVSVNELTGEQDEEDLLGYGKIASSGLPAAHAETRPAAVHMANGSLKRQVLVGDELQDTDDNWLDFMASEPASPGEAEHYSPPPTSPSPEESSPPPVEAPQPVTQFVDGLRLSELLPDPVSPQTDAEDEFIELINKGETVIDLAGHSLKTGSNRSQAYQLPAGQMLEPGERLVIDAAKSGLSLTNSGSLVELYWAEQIIDSVSYPAAKPGQSWSVQADGSWAWASPTPAASNVPPQLAAIVSKARPASKKKTATAKPAAAKKTKQSKAAKPVKAKKAKKVKLATASAKQPEPAKPDASLWVAGGLAMATTGYLAYDYRAWFHRLGDSLRRWLAGRR